MTNYPTASDGFRKGQHVTHERYGTGRIEHVYRADCCADVTFADGETRRGVMLSGLTRVVRRHTYTAFGATRTSENNYPFASIDGTGRVRFHQTRDAAARFPRYTRTRTDGDPGVAS